MHLFSSALTFAAYAKAILLGLAIGGVGLGLLAIYYAAKSSSSDKGDGGSDKPET